MKWGVWGQYFLVLLLGAGLYACGPQQTAPPSPAPTFTLLPATATPSPSPPTQTGPTQAVLNPADLPTYTPAAVAYLPATASQSVQAVLDDLARRSDVDLANLRMVNLRAVSLPGDDELGCQADLSTPADDALEGYRVVLASLARYEVYHALPDGRVQRCSEAPPFTSAGRPLLFDPISESLVENARRNLANRLALTPEQIEWIDVAAITWLDTSLGCPAADATYPAASIAGYRILFQVGSTFYAYHADGLQVRNCPLERAVLPPPFRTTTPSPAPDFNLPTPAPDA